MGQWSWKSTFLSLSVLLVIFLTAAACGGSAGDQNTETIERPAPPAEYAGKTNPLADDGAAERREKTFIRPIAFPAMVKKPWATVRLPIR